MRASLLLAGTAVLAGLGLIARPGEPAPPDGRIVVVRGGEAATAAPVRAGRVEVEPSAPSAAPAFAENDEDFGDPGVWATPAEFDQPETAY